MMNTGIGVYIVAYAIVTAILVIAVAAARLHDETQENPLAYVFWPIIALAAALVCACRILSGDSK